MLWLGLMADVEKNWGTQISRGRARGMGTEMLLKIKEHEKRMLNWQWWHVCVDALEVGLAAVIAGELVIVHCPWHCDCHRTR